MLFTTAAVLALLPCLSLATPFAIPENTPPAGKSPGTNQCDVSTFNNGTKYGITQAPVTDCNALIKNVDKWGQWSLGYDWARLYTQGTCAFSVRVIVGAAVGLIGGADIIDLTGDSIKQFSANGKVSSKGTYNQIVSAEGEVDCNAPTGTVVRVEWVLASSDYNPPTDK